MIRLADKPSDRMLRHPWRNAIAVGRAADLLRADLVKHLDICQRQIGYRYCRFHAIFHDDVAVVVPRPDGTVAYQWHQVDKIYDTLLQLGLRPFVELNPMPAALASGSQTMFYYRMNVTPPKSYEQWGALVEAFVRHCVDRYGLAEVRRWYFEVWNEPNLGAFWAGTKEDYWRLYDAAALAVKRVDEQLRVGGPATSKASWVADMIGHCVENRMPLDFISTHLYPQDEYVEYPDRQGSPHAPGEFFADTIRAVQRTVAASARPDLEIHWTEWNTLSCASTAGVDWMTNPNVDNCWAASFIVKNMLALDDAADTLCWWTASDIFEEGGIPHRPFSGTYGLLTIHGIAKASFNAFVLLNRLRGPVVPVEARLPAGCGVCATQDGATTQVLLWNHQPHEVPNQPTWSDELIVPALPEDAQVIATRLRPGAGSAYETWLALGKPHNLSPAAEMLLRAHAQPECWLQTDCRFTVAPGEVLHLAIQPRGQPALPKGAGLRDLNYWNQAMGERSR